MSIKEIREEQAWRDEAYALRDRIRELEAKVEILKKQHVATRARETETRRVLRELVEAVESSRGTVLE